MTACIRTGQSCYLMQPSSGTGTWNGHPFPAIYWIDEAVGLPDPRPGRWIDSLDLPTIGGIPSAPEAAHRAISALSRALLYLQEGHDDDGWLSEAGSWVVAWRKSLRDRGERREARHCPGSGPERIRRARAALVVLAGIDPADEGCAPSLRLAEAHLRTIWEQGRH